VRSASAGRIALSQPDDLPGSFVARGSLMAYVIGDQASTVRVLVPETDVARLRERPRQIEVILADAPTRPLRASLVRQTPAAVRELPSAALGDRFGGSVLTDPTDSEGIRPLETMFVVDLTLPGDAEQRIGTRAHVRFDHGRAPLLQQWLRRAQQLFVGHLSIGELSPGSEEGAS
jgi:putative peptide zinc metalloprotease protein